MGTRSRPEELDIIPELCAAYVVDPAELQDNSARMVAVATHLEAQARRLVQVEQALAAAEYVPGGVLSAAPARGALGIGGYRLRSTIASIERLAAALLSTARSYQEAEGAAQWAFTRALTGAGHWREMFGTWFPAPIQGITMPLNRFFEAGAKGQLEMFKAAPVRGPGQQVAAMFATGGVYYHQVSSLSPTGWSGYASSVLHSARLMPKALSPLWSSASAGLDREEGALLARSLAGVIAPGGDVSDGAGVAAGAVDALHARLGHRGVRMERVPPKHEDHDSTREPVRTFSGVVSVMAELDPGAGAETGELRIDKVTSPEGETSWQVFIPGGQGFDPRNVHSLLHTARSVDGRTTPSVAMVAAALREVGAQKGEPIVLAGHSHGGITASNFANNPRLRAEFDAPLVVTAGSPVDLHDIRPDTHVVSFEHTEDVIPGADGIQRRAKPGMTRVERTLADSQDPEIAAGSGVHHSHDYPNYVDTARLADAHPGLEHTRSQLAAIIPDGRVETYRFRAEITR